MYEPIFLTSSQRATIVEELREVLAAAKSGTTVYGGREDQDAKITELEEIIEIVNTPAGE